ARRGAGQSTDQREHADRALGPIQRVLQLVARDGREHRDVLKPFLTQFLDRARGRIHLTEDAEHPGLSMLTHDQRSSKPNPSPSPAKRPITPPAPWASHGPWLLA